MIVLYSWPTTNGHEVHIMLEECGVIYQKIPVDMPNRAQFTREYLEMSPTSKVPVLVDPDGPDGEQITLFESTAIMLYLAGKFGKFLGESTREKYMTLQWLMFQTGRFSPMLDQALHFRTRAPEAVPYAINRYTDEAKRLYSVVNMQLTKQRYLAGDHYSVADMATFAWASSWKKHGIHWGDFPCAKRWFDSIGERPAVHRALDVLSVYRRQLVTEDSTENLCEAAY